MSLPLIQGALEKRLSALTPKLPTAFENTPFSPVDGQPYQRATLIPNSPIDHGIAFDVKEWRGLFQVSLMYPLGAGRRAAQDRVELLVDHFDPMQTLSATGLRIELTASPDVGSGFIDDNRWHVPVTVSWSAFKA